MQPTRRQGTTTPPLHGTSGASSIGDHRVLGALGAGGMGEVLLVRDPALEREVALKVIRGQASDDACAKFVREARLTGQLEHPGIVPVYALGAEPGSGTPYFTMRRVSGVDLERLITEGDPPLGERLSIFAKACEAVAYAHERGVIHRDLKPANLMVGQFGEVYVMDWGLAKRMGETVEPVGGERGGEATGQTLDGTILGTPSYMPLEQAEGRISDLDERSDVYSLGAILYFLLSGTAPYSATNALAVVAAVLEGPPEPLALRGRGRDVPWELEAIVAKAMARDPADRYRTVDALRADLEAFRSGRIVSAARYGVADALRKWLVRHPGSVRAAAAVVVAALVTVTAFAVRHRRAVDLAWAQVERCEPGRWVGEARAVPREPMPELRPLPSASELSLHGECLSRLQDASQALAEVLSLAPTDDKARRTQLAVLASIGRLAETCHEDRLAQMAYTQAAQLEIDEAEVRELARQAAGARARRAAHRLARVEALLTLASEGRLDTERRMRDAATEIASYREGATVARLIAAVDEGVEVLKRSAWEAFREAGGAEVDAVRAAFEAQLDPAPPPVSSAERERLFAHLQQWVDRHPPLLDGRRLGSQEIGGLAQRRALAEHGRQGERRLALACEVLGLMHDDTRGIAPLERLVWAAFDERLAAQTGGLALVSLATRHAEAARVLERAVGLDPTSRVVRHFRPEDVFWQLVTRELATIDVASAAGSHGALLTVTDLLDQALAKAGRGDHAGAIADYTRALELDSENAGTHGNRGASRAATGDIQGALADFDRAVELAPGSPKMHANRASMRTQLGDHAGAVEGYTRAIELDPRFAVAHQDRATARRALGDVPGALADYSHAVELDPQLASAYDLRGLLRRETGDHAGAVEDHTRALAIDARNVDALNNRGLAFQAQGDHVAAIADYTRGLELDSRAGALYSNRAISHRARGDYHAAIADCTRALELDPRHRAALHGRGFALRDVGDVAGAADDFSRAIELDPNDGEAYLQRGIVRREAGQLEAALADCTRAVELQPKRATAWMNRGLVRDMARDDDGALADYTRALELEPRYAKALVNRGNVLRGRGDLAGAAADYLAAIEADARVWEAHAGLGMAHAQCGRPREAIECLRQALSLAPPSMHAQLRDLLGKLEQELASGSR